MTKSATEARKEAAAWCCNRATAAENDGLWVSCEDREVEAPWLIYWQHEWIILLRRRRDKRMGLCLSRGVFCFLCVCDTWRLTDWVNVGFVAEQILFSETPTNTHGLTCLDTQEGSRAHVLTSAPCEHMHGPVCRRSQQQAAACLHPPSHTRAVVYLHTQTDAVHRAHACRLARLSLVRLGVMLHAYLRSDWSCLYTWHSDTVLSVLLLLPPPLHSSTYLPLFLSVSR